MSEDERFGFGRIRSDAEKDQQEIQDWLNGSGSMVMAGILILIVIFMVIRAVT